MSITVLTEVSDEVRRLAIAGSVVAGGDFRLKKLIAPLEQAGSKAPVFAKIAQAVTALIDSTAQTSAQALLELTTLVNAVLYTQGETGQAGELQPLEVIDLGFQTTPVGARTLKPLLDAISINGSGRLEIIHDAMARGAFRDMRLVIPALSALDDHYHGVAEYMSRTVVPQYGTSVIPLLMRDYDNPHRLAGKARRLLLLHQLDPVGARATVIEALEGSSKDLRITAISCMGDNAEDAGRLQAQLIARAKEIRHAALKMLLTLNSPAAADVLIKHFAEGDLDGVYYQASQNRSPKLLKYFLDESEKELERFIKSPDKDSATKCYERAYYLIHALRSRSDKATQDFVTKWFARQDELTQSKAPNEGMAILNILIDILQRGSAEMQTLLAQSHARLPKQFLPSAFAAACDCMTPAAVFDSFSSYIGAKAEKKPHPDMVAKHEALVEALWRDHVPRLRDERFSDEESVNSPKTEWDPRWLDLAVKLKDIDVVLARARPGHAGANQLLTVVLEETLEKAKKLDDLERLLMKMSVIQHPGATDSLIKVLTKLASPAAKQVRGISNYREIIYHLPTSAVTRLETLLPTLHEKAISALADAVTKLRVGN